MVTRGSSLFCAGKWAELSSQSRRISRRDALPKAGRSRYAGGAGSPPRQPAVLATETALEVHHYTALSSVQVAGSITGGPGSASVLWIEGADCAVRGRGFRSRRGLDAENGLTPPPAQNRQISLRFIRPIGPMHSLGIGTAWKGRAWKPSLQRRKRSPSGSTPTRSGRGGTRPSSAGRLSRHALPCPLAPACERFPPLQRHRLGNVTQAFVPVTPPTPRRQACLRHVQASTSSSVFMSVP